MEKVALITGASSGIGRETARLFAENGWTVIATMRDMSKGRDLLKYGKVELAHLDVTDSKSISKAIGNAVKRHGRIDVLVNNAGYGLTGPVEAMGEQQIKAEVNTNLVGLIETTRQAIPFMRKQKGGTIVNVSSMAGKITFPMYSIYNATKFGVEGFSESLQFELRPFNINVRLIEPGMVETDFYSRSMVAVSKKEYNTDERAESGRKGVMPSEVAETIYLAATSKSGRMRYTVGSDAQLLTTLRKILPEGAYWRAYRKLVLG